MLWKEENCKLKEMFNLDQLVDGILKVISNITVKECPKTSQGTQYHGNSNYVGKLGQPCMAHGANGALKSQ